MIDQAASLRELVTTRNADRRLAQSVQMQYAAYTVAITSGKGGVGKTSLAVNLGLLLARKKRSIWFMDADFGLANAEVLLGVAPPFNIMHVLRGEVDLESAWLDVADGVRLLSSGSGLEEVADIDGCQAASLIRSVKGLAGPDDIVIVDTGPGIDEPVMSILKAADEVIVVTTPEPTALTDSYATMKVLFSQRPESDVTLVINCCESPSQAESLAKAINNVCQKFLDRSFRRYEYLPLDNSVARAIQAQKPLVMGSYRSRLEPWLWKLANGIERRIKDKQSALPFREAGLRSDYELRTATAGSV